MRSGGKVLLTAISVISSGLRFALRAAAAIRLRTWAIFSAIDIQRDKSLPSCARLGRARTPVPPRARSLATLGMTARGPRFPPHHAKSARDGDPGFAHAAQTAVTLSPSAGLDLRACRHLPAARES